MAGSKTNYLEGAVINHFLRGVSQASPPTVYVALYTIAPTDAGGGTEVTGGAYVRVAATFTDPVLTGSTSNSAEVIYPTATADWGTIVAFGVHDALSGGNFFYWGDVVPNKIVQNGDTPQWAVSDLTISED